MLGLVPLVLSVLIAAPTALDAQESPSEFAVKFVCGQRAAVTGPTANDAVSPGAYFTAVNIHNAGRDMARILSRIATTQSAPVAGQLLPGPDLRIPPGHALEVDCAEILRVAERQPFLKGFLLLRSSAPIDVVAVYTAGRPSDVQSIDVETVSPRATSPRQTAERCPDLTIGRIDRLSPTSTTTRLNVVVLNLGDVDATNVEVYAEDPAGTGPERITTTTAASVPAGGSRSVTLEFSYVISGNARIAGIVVAVDPKNTIAECREDNNRATLGAP